MAATTGNGVNSNDPKKEDEAARAKRKALDAAASSTELNDEQKKQIRQLGKNKNSTITAIKRVTGDSMDQNREVQAALQERVSLLTSRPGRGSTILTR
jgi:predicted phage gp36 major capsid-like protein